jgi:hypothetical protein
MKSVANFNYYFDSTNCFYFYDLLTSKKNLFKIVVFSSNLNYLLIYGKDKFLESIIICSNLAKERI